MDILNELLKQKEFKKHEKIKDYSVSLYESSDFEGLMDLYENIFPGYMSNDLWLWKNDKNPFGKYYTLLMKDKDKIIAAYSAARKEFCINGEILPVIQSMDTMTDKGFQGKGISTYLAKLTYEYAKLDGRYFVYGFPNQTSRYLFEVKLTWNTVITQELFYKDISSKIQSQVDTKGYLIKEIKLFDEKVNDFWEKYKNNYPIIIKKDSSYLNWRFTEHPFVSYKKFLIFDEETNEIISFFVLKTYQDNQGNKFGHIVDFLIGATEESRKLQVFKLIEDFSIKQFKEDCSKISFWMSDEDLRDYISIKLGYSLTQMEIYFGYKIFRKDKNLSILNSLNKWYITMSNNDVF